MKFAHSLVWGQALKPTFRSFSPTHKNLVGQRPQISPTRHPEARNFETAQHINKQIKDVSSTINALLGGISLWGFDASLGNWKTINDAQKLHILSIGAEFSAGWPLLPTYNFSATVAFTSSTYHLGAVASLKFLVIENMLRLWWSCMLSHWQCALGVSCGNLTV